MHYIIIYFIYVQRNNKNNIYKMLKNKICEKILFYIYNIIKIKICKYLILFTILFKKIKYILFNKLFLCLKKIEKLREYFL